MRCGCIDIGSNTTRLLVAEADGHGGLRVLATARAMNRLALGRGVDGSLDPVRLAQVRHDVAVQAALARDAGATRVLAVATAAVRGAPDADAVLSQLDVPSDVEVRILDGETEARLAFSGATGVLSPRPAGRVAVVDVGGGSTEIVVGSCDGGPVWAVSLPIGSGALAEAELCSDPPTAAELGRVRAQSRALLIDLDPPPVEAAWAVGGSATSLAAMLGGGDLSRPSLARALAALCGQDAATIAQRHGLQPERVRMLPAGLVVLDGICELLGVSLQIAPAGLREGVILAMLDERI